MDTPTAAEADPAAGSASRERLTGRLGTTAIVLMVVAAAAPLTVVSSNAPLSIALGNGLGAAWGFVIAAIVLLFFAVGFVSMTPYVRDAGAFFSYVTVGLGGRAGIATSAVALVTYTCIQCAVYGFVGVATNNLVVGFGGPDVAWWIYSFATVALVGLLGYRNIELSSKVLGIALGLEILVVVIYDLVVFVRGGAAGLSAEPLSPTHLAWGTIGVPVTFAIAGFLGFEATAVFRDEARDPERTIPRATYISVGVIGIFYALSTWALILGVGTDQAVAVATESVQGNGTMLVDSIQVYLGAVAKDAAEVLLISSLFACALSFHNVVARYQFALAHRGILPATLGAVSAAHRSPSRSSFVQTVTAAVLLLVLTVIGLDPIVGIYGSTAGIAAIGMMILMLLTTIAVIVFFRRNSAVADVGPLRSMVFPVLAIVGLVFSLVLMSTKFTMITGSNVAISTVLALVPLLAGIAGFAFAMRPGVAQRFLTIDATKENTPS
jgi:amino acid transporter